MEVGLVRENSRILVSKDGNMYLIKKPRINSSFRFPFPVIYFPKTRKKVILP